VDLLALDEPRWRELSEGSPVRRATPEGLARNAAIVLGNAGERAPAGAAAALTEAATGHPSPMVREAAGWARERVSGPRTC
jgi:epoxyqueuosine reductase